MTAAFRKLTALDEIRLGQREEELSLLLQAKGLSRKDADALGHNTTLVWLAAEWEERPSSPLEVLALLSLSEIAELCEEYARYAVDETEWAVNPSFREVTA